MPEKTKVMHPFDQAIALTGTPERRIGQVSAAYQNMVGPYGGVTAATVLQSVLMHPECQGSPVALTVNFLAPMNDNTIELFPTLVRANRTNQHWLITLKQGEDILCCATAVIATRNETWYSQPQPCPVAPQPHQVANMPKVPQVAWLNQYDMRFISGNPFDDRSNAEENDGNQSQSLVWMADDPPRTLDFPSLTALCDAFLPRLFLLRKKLAPIGTVTFTVYFHIHQQDLDQLHANIVLGQAQASICYHSYFDQTGTLWSADNTLLATTSQMVYYKA